MILESSAQGPQQDEQKPESRRGWVSFICSKKYFFFWWNKSFRRHLPCGDGNFGQTAEQNSWWETNKCHHRFIQKVDFAHQHVTGFSSWWNFLHEMKVCLREKQKQSRVHCPGKVELIFWVIYFSGVHQLHCWSSHFRIMSTSLTKKKICIVGWVGYRNCYLLWLM